MLAQTHAKLELVISDNASADATEAFCRALCARDAAGAVSALAGQPRPDRELQHGHRRAARRLRDAALRRRLARPRLRRALPGRAAPSADPVLACGSRALPARRRRASAAASSCNFASSPRARVLDYLRDVDENGLFYGLMPPRRMRRAAPLRNVLGNDWLLVAAIARAGQGEDPDATSINRELDGTSADFAKLCATLGLPRLQARVPHLVIASQLIADIGWRAPAYRDLGPLARARLACAAAWAAIRWRSLIWHMTMPSFAALGKRRGGRWLWNLYLWFARRAGGGL